MYLIDLLALSLGTAIALRFWQGLFGVHDPLFIVIWDAAAICEMLRRVVEARRQGQRPVIICRERLFDFAAALFLAAGLWPIAVSLNGRSPVGTAWHALLPASIGPAVAMVVLGLALRRLAQTVALGQPPFAIVLCTRHEGPGFPFRRRQHVDRQRPRHRRPEAVSDEGSR